MNLQLIEAFCAVLGVIGTILIAQRNKAGIVVIFRVISCGYFMVFQQVSISLWVNICSLHLRVCLDL
jgi:hypothetical protein